MNNKLLRTAFDKDSNSEVAELFLTLRDYIKICIGNEVKEKLNKNSTSFYSKEGAVCSIKVIEDYMYISWLKGSFLEDKYKVLEGKNKVSKLQNVYTLNKTTRESIRYYIDNTIIKLIEHNEILKLKKQMN